MREENLKVKIMKEEIIKRLKDIEIKNDIKIIYAVESGSRMWNFASKNSDYDVRFLYISSPKYYLSVENKKDYILIMDKEKGFDFSGWDIKKALGLLLKRNMSLYEWICSPIVYMKTEEMDGFTDVAQYCWDKKKLIYSYIHLASGNYKAYVLNKPEIKLKKYLYILRTIAACMWLEKYFVAKDLNDVNSAEENTSHEFCPISIDVISEMIKNDNGYIYNLLQKIIKTKRDGEELTLSCPDEQANMWVEEKIKYYKSMDNDLKISKSKYKKMKSKIGKMLDDFFYKIILQRLVSVS